MLSRAMMLLLAATLGTDAALQAKSKNAEANKIDQMVTVSGECARLIHAGLAVNGCKPILLNMNYSTGMSAYWFVTEGTVLSFSGDEARRVEQGPDIVVQAIEKVILAAKTGASKAETTKEEDSIGFCRFGDPTIKGSPLECMTYTQAGSYEGTFFADGSPPKLETFQVGE